MDTRSRTAVAWFLTSMHEALYTLILVPIADLNCNDKDNNKKLDKSDSN